GKGSAPRRRAIRRAGVRTFATTAGWVLAVVLLLPHLTLVLVSLVPYGTWTTETLPPVLSLVNYRRLFSEAERLRPLVNSVWMAAASTCAAVALALAAGALVGRRRPWQFRGPIEALLALPWALPAGGSLAFVAALGDFVTSIVLYTPDNRPISIEIMSSLRVSELGVAAGFGVILMVLSAVVLGVGARR